MKIRCFFLLLALFLIAPSVYAYLDPGTGSMLLQLLIGGIAAALLSIKVYWKKIKGLLVRIFSKDVSSEESDTLEKVDNSGNDG